VDYPQLRASDVARYRIATKLEEDRHSCEKIGGGVRGVRVVRVLRLSQTLLAAVVLQYLRDEELVVEL